MCDIVVKTFTFAISSLDEFLYLNKVTNLYQLASRSTTSCHTTWRSYCDHRLLWRYFTISIPYTSVIALLLRCKWDIWAEFF